MTHFSYVMKKAKRAVSNVWRAELFLFWQMRCGSGDKYRQATTMQRLDVTDLSHALEDSSGDFCVSWFTLYEMHPNDCRKNLEYGDVNVRE